MSQTAKEKALEDLRKIREEILQRERNSDTKQTSRTPSKLDDSIKKKKSKKNKEKKSHKKHKKEKHKQKSRKNERRSSSSSSEDDEEEVPPKKRSCSPEEILPKKWSCSPEEKPIRDDWMTSAVMLKTFSKNKPPSKKESTYVEYEPGKSTRELNPHWRDGGSGLPSFKKPKEDFDDEDDYYSSKSSKRTSRGWAKKPETSVSEEKPQDERVSSSGTSESNKPSEYLTDQQMNELGAKIMKAEILNNKELADELKEKLKSARLYREQNPSKETDKVKNKNHKKPQADRNRRVRPYADDDGFDFKKKFEREKSQTSKPAKSSEKQRVYNEDLEDIFESAPSADPQQADKDKQQEIREEIRQNKKISNCDRCFNGNKVNKELVVSVGKHVYVALPWHEGLQINHCLIMPIDHYSCSKDLDEDVWREISSYRRILTKLFAKRDQDVLFFETAKYLQRHNHMVIHCIPSKSFEMAPFYFKKGIEESEYEWSKNKQLVTLKDKNLRKSIPCGLPYFWVHFGIDYGFAHVIENQEMFPSHFAQEIIAGMLTLDMRKWRNPREEHNIKTKVKNLADLLKPYESEIG